MADRIDAFLDDEPVELRWYDHLFIMWNWHILKIDRELRRLRKELQKSQRQPDS